jgi:hypothetical protein
MSVAAGTFSLMNLDVDFTGALFSGSVWLAAVVLAWPAQHPYAAVAVLGTHALMVAVFSRR